MEKGAKSMWFWNGTYWQFVSLAGPWFPAAASSISVPPTRQTIHEMPVAVPEYLARIREHCD
jgi:hypothetical protein